MTTMRCVHLFLSLGLASACAAQDYSTPDQFTFTVESDVLYGIDTNYLGSRDTLLLDVYKPIGNPDTERPLVVFVHGGTWLGGCKDDPAGIVPLIHQFATRGYVVASVNYRLGWHKDDYVGGAVAGFPPSLWPETYRALYALDSLEMKRAIFRGMQDVKGAIRFMKARAEQDSVCIEKVLVAGESAGGFVAMAVAFLDRPEEKPPACYALPDAPPPYANLLNATALNCEQDTYAVSGSMLARPDLGSVDGDLNSNGHSADVRGVASFYGGVPSDAFTQDWLQGADTPSVYLYHQTCDGVVLFDHGRPMTTISANCNLGSTPWHYNYPTLYGSGALANAYASMSAPPAYITDFEACPWFDWTQALFECSRYANNGSYHFTANHALRGANLSAWWAGIATGPSGCLSTGSPDRTAMVFAFPIPADNMLFLPGVDGSTVVLTDATGHWSGARTLTSGRIEVGDLPNGTYIARFPSAQWGPVRFVVLH